MTTDSSLSLEYILTKYNNERITLMFDYSCKYFNNFECILNKFRPSEVFKFSFWKNGKKYFYDENIVVLRMNLLNIRYYVILLF